MSIQSSLTVLLILTLSGCTNPFSPYAPIPENIVRMTASAVSGYSVYWAEVEADAGKKGDYERIDWYLVPGGPWPWENGRTMIRGLWARDGHRIFIASGYERNPAVIRHEMLHELLNDPSHHNPLFALTKY